MVGVIFLAYAIVNIVICIPLMIIFCLKKSLVRSVKYKFPIAAFIAWACFVVTILITGVAYMIVDDPEVKATIAALIIIYGIYVIVTCVAPAFRATFRKFDVSEFDTHLQNLRNSGVDLHFEIVASHTEHTTHTDSNGNKSTSSHTVVTYRKTRYVGVPFWIDLTNPIVIPSVSPYIRVIGKPKVEWCHDSDKIIEGMRRHLYEKNKHRDKDVTVTTYVGIPGMIKNLLLRSPVIEPTTFQKIRVNPATGLILTLLGFGGQHAFILARSLPVVKHKVHKKASLVQPVVDDSWLKQYKVKGAVMTPRGAVFGNVQMVDKWDGNANSYDDYTATQPMFVNPMPLYVTYETALQYETPSAPPMPYMCMEAGYGPGPDQMAAVPSAPADPNAGNYPPQDPNAMAAYPPQGAYPPQDPNAMGAYPQQGAPGAYPGAYPPQDPNAMGAYPPQDPNIVATTTTTTTTQ